MKNKLLVVVELILGLIAFYFAILWIKYPDKNYEPFTVAPALISGLFEVARRLISKDNSSKAKEATVDSPDNNLVDNFDNKKISNITVNEIVNSINNSAPFLKDEMSIKYNGVRIKWMGYLKSATLIENDKVNINCNVNKNDIIGKSFWFSENIQKIPEIRTLPEKSKICVLGDIISASGPGISVTIKPIDIEIIRDN